MKPQLPWPLNKNSKLGLMGKVSRGILCFSIQATLLVLGLITLYFRGNSIPVLKPGPPRLGEPFIFPSLKNIAQYRSGDLPESPEYRFEKSDVKVVMTFALDQQSELPDLYAIISARKDYARRYGYGIYCQYISQVQPGDGKAAHFSRFALLREAMHIFPRAEWLWYFDSRAEIRNASQSVDWVLDQEGLDTAMLRNTPVSLDDQQIKSYRHNSPETVDFVFGRTKAGLATNAFLVRNSVRATGFVEFALNPLNVHYQPFLESGDPSATLATHIALWHPQFLSHMALVPTRMLVSTNQQSEVDETYVHGDFAYIAV